MNSVLHTLPIFSLISAIACAPAPVELTMADGTTIQSDGSFGDGTDGGGGGQSADSDGDGLSDSDEADLGTDPNSPDTDGDGWADGEEVESFTDPVDETDHPYTGGYGIDACRNDIEATGSAVGDIADNFELMDQFGETVKLHDFCERTVLLVSAAFW